MLSGKLAPLNADAVRREGDERVLCGTFTQDLAADLPTNLSALQHLEKIAPDATVERLRSTLGGLGIRGSAALREMQYLSGGEQARVALATFVVQPFNVLLLDEISNHLDIESVETIIDALVSFNGVAVIVSHDRRLIERVATHCIVVEDQTATIFDGVPQRALNMITPTADGPATLDATDMMSSSSSADSSAASASAASPLDKKARIALFQEQKEAKRRITRAKKRLPAVEVDIGKQEGMLVKLANEMEAAGSDAGKAMDVQARVDKAEKAIEGLYEEMERLESFLAETAAVAV